MSWLADYLKTFPRFNLSRVDCKFPICTSQPSTDTRFNLSRVDCKFTFKKVCGSIKHCFNLSRVDCKFSEPEQLIKKEESVLIYPEWIVNL